MNLMQIGICFLAFITLAHGKQINYEQNLVKALMQDYEPTVPPFSPQPNTNSSRTQITLQLEIFGIKDVSLHEGTVTFTAAVRQWWNDSRLIWNPDDYGGIGMIFLKTDPEITPRSWISDILVREDAGTGYLSDLKHTDVMVLSNGLCYNSRAGDLQVRTSFDLSKFPYDTQNITITFESWMYNDSRVSLQLHEVPTKFEDPDSWLLENIEWELETIHHEQVSFQGTTGTFNRVIYNVVMIREGNSMFYSILIPGSLISLMGNLYYFLPIGKGERISYLTTILLTEIMFLVMFSNMIPLSNSTPQLDWLYLGYTIQLSLIIFISLILEKIYRRLRKQIKETKKYRKEYQKDQTEKIANPNSINNDFQASNLKVMQNRREDSIESVNNDFSEIETKNKKPAKKKAKIDFTKFNSIFNETQIDLESSNQQTPPKITQTSIKTNSTLRIISILDLLVFVVANLVTIIISALKFSTLL